MPLIQAPPGAVKVRPDNPGGLQLNTQTSALLGSNGSAADANLAPAPPRCRIRRTRGGGHSGAGAAGPDCRASFYRCADRVRAIGGDSRAARSERADGAGNACGIRVATDGHEQAAPVSRCGRGA